MVPPDQIYLPALSADLTDAIGALPLHMSDTAQTTQIWAELSASLKILPAAVGKFLYSGPAICYKKGRAPGSAFFPCAGDPEREDLKW